MAQWKDRGKRTLKELDGLVGEWKIMISGKWVAYATSGAHRKDAKILNDRIEDVKHTPLDNAAYPSITKAFMENFQHNVRLLADKWSNSMVDYDCRYSIKPAEIINDVQDWYKKIDEWRKEPATLAGICHALRCSRDRLTRMLNSRGYDGAKVLVQNILLKYAENYLFTGKNINWAVFYLKNLYPEIYQDKQTTETNVKISLVDLSKKADALEFKMKQGNIIKWEIVKDPNEHKYKWWDRAEKILFNDEKPKEDINDEE